MQGAGQRAEVMNMTRVGEYDRHSGETRAPAVCGEGGDTSQRCLDRAAHWTTILAKSIREYRSVYEEMSRWGPREGFKIRV